MTVGILGKKIGMTRVFGEQGEMIPVTVIEAGPCPIIQVKTSDTDGYNAVKVGFDAVKPNKVKKPQLGIFEKAKVDPVRFIREFRVNDAGEFEVGKSIKVDIFQPGERIDVSGISKGKGFAGTVKRHRTHRGPETHGSMYHRRPGSMGASADPSHVLKGKKLPGQMGNEKVSVLNLQVVSADAEKNILLVKGAVPGANNGYVVIRKSVKSKGNAE